MRFNIIHVPNVGSTNLYAQKLIEKGSLSEGDVIFTNNQTRGTGQGSNKWESEPNSNLTFSLLLEPGFIMPANQFVLTQIISLSIVDVLESYLHSGEIKSNVKVKWPNDIYVSDNKIAGILFKNFVKGNKIDFSIVGVGININQCDFYSDAKNPTSLIHHIHKRIDVMELLELLLSNAGHRYELLRCNRSYSTLKSEYMNNLYRYNEWSKYSDNIGLFTGKIVDVDLFGKLTMELKNGDLKRYTFKEVEFR